MKCYSKIRRCPLQRVAAKRMVLFAFLLAGIGIDPLDNQKCSGITHSQSNPNLNVYRDKRYGFEISFPKSMQLSRDFVGFYLIAGNVWRQVFFKDSTTYTGGDHDDKGVPVVSVIVYRSEVEGYPDVEVRIGVHLGKTPKEACGWITDNSRENIATINGHIFRVINISGAGVGHSLEGESYQIFHRGNCYAIERFVTYTHAAIHENNKRTADSFYQKTKTIVKSFRFLTD